MYILITMVIEILFFKIFIRKTNYKNIIISTLILITTLILSLALTKIQINDSFNIFSINYNKKLITIWTLNNILINTIIMVITNFKLLKNKIKTNIKIKYLYFFIFSLAFAILFELFIFNFRHYESLIYNNSKNLIINKMDNIEKLDENKYKLLNAKNYIEFININENINNLYLDIISLEKMDLDYTIYAADEANELYYKLPSRTLVNTLDQDKYIKMNLSGKASKLKITFNYNEEIGNIIKINNIKINVIKPIHISLYRIAFILAILYLLYLIRPSSELYKYKLIDNKYKRIKNIIIILFLIIESALFILLTNSNPFFKNPTINQLQYNKLAESLKDGQVYIKDEPSNTLREMKNPYDFNLRYSLHDKNNENYLWDYSYYKDRYYVYFGIVPELIFYLPFYLITGYQMKNTIVICSLLILISIIIFKLVNFLSRKWFRNVSFIHYMMICCLFINTSFLLYPAKRPDFYSIPILSALFFSLIGIYLWITSLDKEKINKKRLFFGSLCMALVVGCRPQFLLGSFLCIPIFWEYFKKNKNLKEFIYFALPYISVAILLMYYNYIRFDSPFDFGANYNLTGNDMTKRGFKLDRTFLGIFYSLFSLPIISTIYPFIEPSNIKTQFMGNTIWEPSFGGLLSTNIILILGITSFKFKKLINNKTLYNISIMCNIFALIIIIADTQMAGVLPRYILDFSWLLFISTTIVLLAILNNIKEKHNMYIFNIIFYSLFIVSIAYNLLLIPVDFSLSLKENNPILFYRLGYLIQFWL